MLPSKPSKVNPSFFPSHAPLYAGSARAQLDQYFDEQERHRNALEEFLRPTVAERRSAAELANAASGARQYAKVQAILKNQEVIERQFHDISNDGERMQGVDKSTGEIEEFDIKGGKFKKVVDPDHARTQRYRLQHYAGKLLPNARVAHCMKTLNKYSDDVTVMKSKEFDNCTFKGVQTCGSVWVCPVCAAKISARRSEELKIAMNAHRDNGGALLMVTYTFPHSREDELKDMMKRLSKAMTFNKGHRDYKDIKPQVGLIGTVRALEVTHGHGNGWHPHIHEIWFVRSGVDCDWLKSELHGCWKNAATKNGFMPPSWEHGVDVKPIDDTDKAAEYMAKEMTAQASKHGRGGNRSPFDLLRDYADGDAHSGALFEEYVFAFKRQLQLRWSNGLKALFLIDEVTDEELAATQEETAVEVGTISKDEWKALLRAESAAPNTSPRATVLNLAAKDWALAEVYINGIVSAFPPSSPSLSRC